MPRMHRYNVTKNFIRILADVKRDKYLFRYLKLSSVIEQLKFLGARMLGSRQTKSFNHHGTCYIGTAASVDNDATDFASDLAPSVEDILLLEIILHALET